MSLKNFDLENYLDNSGWTGANLAELQGIKRRRLRLPVVTAMLRA
jgi:hypothetical protein